MALPKPCKNYRLPALHCKVIKNDTAENTGTSDCKQIFFEKKVARLIHDHRLELRSRLRPAFLLAPREGATSGFDANRKSGRLTTIAKKSNIAKTFTRSHDWVPSAKGGFNGTDVCCDPQR